MAQVIGFVSEKGGVGKTTAVYHIGVSLKRDHQASVLLLDTDYQRGGLTCRLIPEMLEDFRLGQVVDQTLYAAYRSLYAEAELPELTVRETNVGLDLMPADPKLNAVSVDKLPASRNLRESNELLLRHLTLIGETIARVAGDYDYVLIDSHPDLHDLEKAVIAASDYLVSPVKLDQQSSVAVASTRQAMNDVNADIQTALAYAKTVHPDVLSRSCWHDVQRVPRYAEILRGACLQTPLSNNRDVRILCDGRRRHSAGCIRVLPSL